MVLQYRCSNCGTVLYTTNADPLHEEIERLRKHKRKQAEEIETLSRQVAGLEKEIERLDEENERLRVTIDRDNNER